VTRGGAVSPWGGLAARTTHRQRWAIVQYVRHLQTQAGGTPPAGGTGPGGTGGGN
jgi:hypothetical protein